jgi:putative membrane protein
MKATLMAAAAALVMFTAPGLAQESSAATENSKAAVEAMAKVTSARDFASHAAMSDMFEIQTGQMAQDQGGSDQARQLGQMLVQDHSASSKELMDLAKAAGVDTAPPAALDQRHQVIVDSLKDAKGSGFDKAFGQAQVQAHQEAIALFEAYSQNGDNKDLQAFAKKGLPKLQQHLEMAQQVAGTAQTQ